jgi:hypothetical protein
MPLFRTRTYISLTKHRIPGPASAFPSRSLASSSISNKMGKDKDGNKRSDGHEPHQYQAGSGTSHKEEHWKERPPYRIQDKEAGFDVKWRGKCHCGAVQYELSSDKPLASKYCHCTTCQRMHGVGWISWLLH